MENMDRVEALYWNEKYKELEEHVIELADKLDLMELKEAKARMKIEELERENFIGRCEKCLKSS